MLSSIAASADVRSCIALSPRQRLFHIRFAFAFDLLPPGAVEMDKRPIAGAFIRHS
jgi:hypothetical protein